MTDAGRIGALLERLGFTEYEARAYLTLLGRNPLTGYELAKLSGIPRPNVYPVLDRPGAGPAWLEEIGRILEQPIEPA